MTKRQYRVKTELYKINNLEVSAIVICSGHGYDFETYCCKDCGELFVLELELLFHQELSLETLIIDKQCPKCLRKLSYCLVKYPENIFSQDSLFENDNAIDRSCFENTELVEIFVLE